tara:strand:+ start:429 stop:1001 length:573 start_codon:yes stop_codon:yes gene_type:complete
VQQQIPRITGPIKENGPTPDSAYLGGPISDDQWLEYLSIQAYDFLMAIKIRSGHMPPETEQPETGIDNSEVSRIALKTFFNISDAWDLTEQEEKELLGNPSPSLYQQWRAGNGPIVSQATLVRISYVLGIYKNLRILYPDESRANAWIRKPNKAFAGASGLERMIQDLASVRHYLDSFVDYPSPSAISDS